MNPVKISSILDFSKADDVCVFATISLLLHKSIALAILLDNTRYVE